MPLKPVLRIGLNKIALLRGSRDGDRPSLEAAARLLIEAGATSLLLHLWPDRRHAQPEDLEILMGLEAVREGRASVSVGGPPDRDLADLIFTWPGIDTWVITPFVAAHRTTMRGWTSADESALAAMAGLARGRVKTALFVDPGLEGVSLARAAGADGIEISCRDLVESGGSAEALQSIVDTVEGARDAGLGVALAHDLDEPLVATLAARTAPDIISVGHAFIADALLAGLAPAFADYSKRLGGR